MHYLHNEDIGAPNRQQGLHWLRLSALQGFERAQEAICFEDREWATERLSLACTGA
jgi:hypothetical protein